MILKFRTWHEPLQCKPNGVSESRTIEVQEYFYSPKPNPYGSLEIGYVDRNGKLLSHHICYGNTVLYVMNDSGKTIDTIEFRYSNYDKDCDHKNQIEENNQSLCIDCGKKFDVLEGGSTLKINTSETPEVMVINSDVEINGKLTTN